MRLAGTAVCELIKYHKKIAYLRTYADWYTQEDCGFELGNQTKNMGISGLRN
jgi:hypothetical protein